MAMKMAKLNGGDPITTETNWDDPPSTLLAGLIFQDSVS